MKYANGRSVMSDIQWESIVLGVIFGLLAIIILALSIEGSKGEFARKCDEQGYFVFHGTIYKCERSVIGN